ncbi:Candidapepsin [Tolypocladium ophioglossoides CBS 100239]|uniref:Candidapepsin n=1 Tax=Tolypocladium ophioglossoides (strain CBS 100239) TaxID=1163406 RepID=A0A0L0N225_TOLOC|nr:Candidapepsin [Tolypocladium ophioglossoides CBS 100239]
MRLTNSATAASATVIALAGVARALDPVPVALQAGDWLGIDGNWSTVSFLLGSNSDFVNVLVSTSLSEFWAIGPGGCLEKEPYCAAARGGIYSPTKSKHWSPMGLWQLGLQYLGYRANGEYGLDTINAYSPITDIGFGMSNVLMAAINTTSPYLGFFGLGIEPGRFGNMVADSPLTQAVKTFGWIPSYSYGFTAGAHYRNTIVSATLGGYDTARFVSHDTTFAMTSGETITRTLVRGIQVAANKGNDKPDVWSSRTEILSDWNSSFTAMIDSSTAYLWLPEAVCDRFARALNLTYNSTFDLYTLTNQQYRDYTSKDALTFTFSLTSFDNNDNFGLPLEVAGVVNITLPLQAFVSLLQYPFRDAIKYADPAVPYFTLRKSRGNSFVIGRAFLQESYIITKFDEARYSIHQALFPANPEHDASLQKIKQSPNSPFPPPPTPAHSDPLSTGQMVGIAVGAVLMCATMLLGWCCWRRRRRSRRVKDSDEADDNKDSTSTLTPDSPRTPVSRILSKLARRKQLRRTRRDTGDGVQFPSEAPDCQIYELPAPAPPAELDGGSDDNSIIGETEPGTDNTRNLGAYELARRKLDRQLQGPVPAYVPPADATLPPEKAIPDLRPAQVNQLPDQPSPISPTRSRGGDSNSFPASEPSPISPRTEWNTHSTDLPSPLTPSEPPRSISSSTGSRGGQISSCTGDPGRSHSVTSTAPVSPTADTLPSIPAASFQRTPIDPSKIVCLGPLPENVQIRRQNMMPRAAGTDGRSIPTPMFSAISLPSEGSLGSNYTEEEERIVKEMTRQASLSYVRSSQSYQRSSSHRGGQDRAVLPFHTEESALSSRILESETLSRRGRIDPGRDLIHVPQMAAKRYSWEEER